MIYNNYLVSQQLMQPIEQPLKEEEFHVGQNIDVLDCVKKWMNAEIRFVGNGTIYIHYSGWAAKYDESIAIKSERILKQWQPGHQIRLNNRVDAYHPLRGWLESRVIEIQQSVQNNSNTDLTKCMVKVHYFNYHKKYDQWLKLDNPNQIRIIGEKSKAYGMGRNRKKTENKLSEILTKILQEKAKVLQEKLDMKNWAVKQSGGDGNCLFRSVSDLLYGSQQYHAQIRKICMDYISYQKHFFENYISDDIDEYIETKRKDGSWGDDVEIQALSQIYARPIEIYVFDDTPIRTFHQQNENKIEPLRLNYVGACHYNSVKQKDKFEEGIMQSKFGEFEQLFLSTYKTHMGNINRNRDLFSNCNRIEDTIGQQLEAQKREQTKIQDQLSKALQISQTEALMEQIQDAELKQIQSKYEQEKLQEELRKIEQKQLQQIKRLSHQEQQLKQSEQIIELEKPYWFDTLTCQGFSDTQIWFAIDIKGLDPDAVQNFLLDNMLI